MFTKKRKSLAVRLGLILVLLGGILGTSPAKPALASTITVTNENSNGSGSLSQTIMSAASGDAFTVLSASTSLDIPSGNTFSPTLAVPNNWAALGAGLNSQVVDIAISSTGDVYAVGSFIDAGGYAAADSIAKWNGTSWSALGTTVLNGSVIAIAISETDEIYVGGLFTNAGGDPNADYIAKWNGISWSALGTSPLTDYVYSIAVNGNEVYAGGFFLNAGGDPNADRIAQWDGTSWSALGAPFSANVFSIALDKATGDVYAGGGFTNAGGDPNADYIAKWNGNSWSALGTIPFKLLRLGHCHH